MWQDWLVALALVLVIEGLMPLLHPSGMRRAMMVVASLSDGQLRIMGAASMLVGLAALYVIN